MALSPHPNVKMFISHGGQLSSLESVHFGKPVIGIPVFFDQYTNIYKASRSGYALRVPLSHNLPKDMKSAINTMLTDDRYAKKAKELSALYHDRQNKPGPTLVYWVEYVVRTRGATHLRSAAFYVPLYQRLYLDLIALILTVVAALIFLLSRICKKTKPKSNDQKKRN